MSGMGLTFQLGKNAEVWRKLVQGGAGSVSQQGSHIAAEQMQGTPELRILLPLAHPQASASTCAAPANAHLLHIQQLTLPAVQQQ